MKDKKDKKKIINVEKDIKGKKWKRENERTWERE